MAELKEESSEATCEGASKEFCSETPLEDKTNLLQTTPTRDSGWYSTFEDARKAIEEDELSTFTRYASWVTKSFKGDSSIKKEGKYH